MCCRFVLSPTAIFFLRLQKEYGKKNRPKRGEESPLFGNTPQCGEGNGIVPHNQNRNLSVLPSFSAQDAAAFWRLFGVTQIAPRSKCLRNFLPQQAALRSQPPDHRRLPAPSNKSEAFFLSLWGPGGRNPRSPFGNFPSIRKVTRRRQLTPQPSILPKGKALKARPDLKGKAWRRDEGIAPTGVTGGAPSRCALRGAHDKGGFEHLIRHLLCKCHLPLKGKALRV